MLLADANGGWDYVSPEATPSPTPTTTPSVEPIPVPTQATSSTELPTFEQGVVDPTPTTNYSWIMFLVLVVAVVGMIITLFLRNRK